MAISEKDLLEAGFSNREVDTLLERLAATGGTMQGLIAALLRRFRVSVWITVALVLVMLVTLIAGSRTHILCGDEFPRCPDHCLGDHSSGSWLECIPPAEDCPRQASTKVITRNHLQVIGRA